ncbi:MAG: magnesium transporter [Acidimicrobiales bacterium]
MARTRDRSRRPPLERIPRPAREGAARARASAQKVVVVAKGRPRPLRWLVRRLLGLLGPDAAAVRQSLVALGLNSSTSLVAGAVLGSITGTFAELPGLLVLVPAAIGLRGNIFGAFGNRISTTIHAGTFELSTKRTTVLGQNVTAVLCLTLAMSGLLAVIAKSVAVALGITNTISILDLALISVVGGLLASVLVLVGALALTAGAVRYDWDLDNVTAPLVSTMGDVLTLPALYVATFLVGISVVTPVIGLAALALSAGALVLGALSRLELLRRIVRESLPVLVVAGAVSAMAGIVLERRFEAFVGLPALLVLVPAHLSSAGALGGILSGRLSTKLVLGIVSPTAFPGREARGDIALVFLLGLPVYLFNGVGAHVVSGLLDHPSPGLAQMIGVSLIGGTVAVCFVVAVAYYGTIAAVRTGLDPDTYGIPVVSSSVDFVGAFTLVLTIALLGLA